MIRVVSRVTDVHVLEKSAICSKGVVCPGPNLLSVLLHYPRAPILQPRITPWEEVKTHVHPPPHGEIVRNALRLLCAFRIHQSGIEISSHQDLVPVRSILDDLSNIIYG